jgi:hypothetical protein
MDQNETPTGGAFAAFAEKLARNGVKTTLRQVASLAAISWGTNSALSQATEAQERADEARVAALAAEERLAEIEAQIDRASDTLLDLNSQIRTSVLVDEHKPLYDLVRSALQSGEFDDLVTVRAAAIRRAADRERARQHDLEFSTSSEDAIMDDPDIESTHCFPCDDDQCAICPAARKQ